MIVQTICKDFVVGSGDNNLVTITLNRSGAGHRATFQLTGLILEESEFSLLGRLHPDAPWSYIDTGALFGGTDYILSIPICEQYQLTLDNQSASPMTISAWIAN